MLGRSSPKSSFRIKAKKLHWSLKTKKLSWSDSKANLRFIEETYKNQTKEIDWRNQYFARGITERFQIGMEYSNKLDSRRGWPDDCIAENQAWWIAGKIIKIIDGGAWWISWYWCYSES